MSPGTEKMASIRDHNYPDAGGKQRKLETNSNPRSGRYKRLIILAVTLSSFSYALLMLRWHGNTNVWESLYIFPRFA
jgi:hypothetical protein